MDYKIELRYGIIAGVLSFLWLYGEYAFGLHITYIDLHPIITNFALLIPIICLPLGIRAKRNQYYKGNITFWQGLQSGMIMSALFGAISVIGVFIYYKAINPGWYEFVVEHYKTVGPNRGMNAIEAEAYAKMYFSMKAYMSQALFGSIATGGFISMVAAWLMKTKK